MHGEEIVMGGNPAAAQRIVDEHNARAERLRKLREQGNQDAAMDPREIIGEESTTVLDSMHHELIKRRPASGSGERHYFA